MFKLTTMLFIGAAAATIAAIFGLTAVSHGGDAACFCKAANTNSRAATFAWAAASQGCECGQGCPCCASGSPCICANGTCKKNEIYNALREKAIRENKTLLVFVACDPPKGLNDLSCRLDDFPGLRPNTVAVCRTVNGKFVRVAEAAPSAYQTVLPSVVPSCPNGQCQPVGLAHPLEDALLALTVGFIEGDCPGGVCPPRQPVVRLFEAPATQKVVSATVTVASAPVTVVRVVHRVHPVRRLAAAPFRFFRFLRHR